jgi:hypothetical protein
MSMIVSKFTHTGAKEADLSGVQRLKGQLRGVPPGRPGLHRVDQYPHLNISETRTSGGLVLTVPRTSGIQLDPSFNKVVRERVR